MPRFSPSAGSMPSFSMSSFIVSSFTSPNAVDLHLAQTRCGDVRVPGIEIAVAERPLFGMRIKMMVSVLVASSPARNVANSSTDSGLPCVGAAVPRPPAGCRWRRRPHRHPGAAVLMCLMPSPETVDLRPRHAGGQHTRRRTPWRGRAGNRTGTSAQATGEPPPIPVAWSRRARRYPRRRERRTARGDGDLFTGPAPRSGSSSSLTVATVGPVNVVMADNGSVDGSPEAAASRYTNVTLLRTGRIWAGRARKLRSRLARSSTSEFSSSPTRRGWGPRQHRRSSVAQRWPRWPRPSDPLIRDPDGSGVSVGAAPAEHHPRRHACRRRPVLEEQPVDRCLPAGPRRTG